MTAKAIDVLSQNDQGFVLMVEAGRIDHAHHAGNAYRALEDTVALDAAVQAAYDKVDPEETLIIVTADHSHVFTIAGYPERNNPILGIAGTADDGKPYTTLGYMNGPGAVAGERPDLTDVDTADPDYPAAGADPARGERDPRRRRRRHLRPGAVGAPVRRGDGAEPDLPRHRPRDRPAREGGALRPLELTGTTRGAGP